MNSESTAEYLQKYKDLPLWSGLGWYCFPRKVQICSKIQVLIQAPPPLIRFMVICRLPSLLSFGDVRLSPVDELSNKAKNRFRT